jgi:Asp-tRNA(Asn)/Glu-tRNA(Gln) amidotransferase C subunit
MLEDIKKLISQNKVKEALFLLKKYGKTSDSIEKYFEVTIIILSSRLSEYDLKESMGYDVKQLSIEIKESILKIAKDINQFDHNKNREPIAHIIPIENFNIVRTKREKRKKDYYILIGIIVLISIFLVTTSLKSDQDNLYTIIGTIPLGLIKWIKDKLDAIEKSLTLLKMLENEIKDFIEKLKNPPTPNVDETVINIKQQFWDIVK